MQVLVISVVICAVICGGVYWSLRKAPLISKEVQTSSDEQLVPNPYLTTASNKVRAKSLDDTPSDLDTVKGSLDDQ